MRDLLLTRRRLLFIAGPGVLGVTLVNTVTGCSTSPGPTGSSPTSGPTPPPGPTGTAGPIGGDWRRVNLSFVSAYLLIRGAEAAVVDLGTAGSAAAIGTARSRPPAATGRRCRT